MERVTSSSYKGLNFHLYSGYLENDIRGQIYELLIALSLSVHTDLQVGYEKYPKR